MNNQKEPIKIVMVQTCSGKSYFIRKNFPNAFIYTYTNIKKI